MEPIIIERMLPAPIEKVWRALTEKDEMKAWYFDVSGFEPVAGFQFSFTGMGAKGEEYVHLCEVRRAEQPYLLEYSWSYRGFPGSSLVCFELEDAGSDTRIRVTHHGIETLEQNGSDFKADNFREGWSGLIGKNLPDYLKKTD